MGFHQQDNTIKLQWIVKSTGEFINSISWSCYIGYHDYGLFTFLEKTVYYLDTFFCNGFSWLQICKYNFGGYDARLPSSSVDVKMALRSVRIVCITSTTELTLLHWKKYHLCVNTIHSELMLFMTFVLCCKHNLVSLLILCSPLWWERYESILVLLRIYCSNYWTCIGQ